MITPEGTYQSSIYEMQSFTGTPGTPQSLQYDLRGLPRGQRVAAFVLAADFNLTNNGGAPVNTDTYNLIASSISQYDHASDFYRVRATGAGLFRLFQHMNGRSLQEDAVTIAPGNAIYCRAVNVLPLSDANAYSPNDTSVPTELINGTSLQVVTTGITFNNLFGVGANVSGSVAYRLFAILIEGAGAIDPTATRIDYEDWGGQTVLLKPGTYSHLAAYKEPGVSPYITLDTDIQRVTWNIRGTPVLQNVLSWMQVVEFNRASVAGGFVDNNREQLSDRQVPFLPIYTPSSRYKLTGLPHTNQPDSLLQFNGSQTSFRILYRSIPEKNESQIRAAGRAFGLSEFERGLKTVSKSDVAGGSNAPEDVLRRSRISKLIPGRLSAVFPRGR